MGDSPSQNQSDVEMAEAGEVDPCSSGAANSSGTSQPQEGSEGAMSHRLPFTLQFSLNDEPRPAARVHSNYFSVGDRHLSGSTSSCLEFHTPPQASLPDNSVSSTLTLEAAPSHSAAHTSFFPRNRETFQPGPASLAPSRPRWRLPKRERVKRPSPPNRRLAPLVPKRQRLTEEAQHRLNGRNLLSNNMLHPARSSETISSGAGSSADLDVHIGNEGTATEPDSQQGSNGSTTDAVVSQAQRVPETPLGLQRSSEPVPQAPFSSYQRSSPVPEADSTTGRPLRGILLNTHLAPAGNGTERQTSSREPVSSLNQPMWRTPPRTRPLIPFHRRLEQSPFSLIRENQRSLPMPYPRYILNRHRFSVRDANPAGAAHAQLRSSLQSPRTVHSEAMARSDDDRLPASTMDLGSLAADALLGVPRSMSGTVAADATLGVSRNVYGRDEESTNRYGSPRSSPVMVDGVLGVPGRMSSRAQVGSNQYGSPHSSPERPSEVVQNLAQRGPQWNEGPSSGAANSSSGGTSAAILGSRTLRGLYDDVVPRPALSNPVDYFSHLDNSPGSTSSGSTGSVSDAIRRGVPMTLASLHYMDLSDSEEVILVHDSESESDSEESDVPPPVELPMRGARTTPGVARSVPPRPGSGPPRMPRVRSPQPPDYSFPILNDFLQYETDEDLARRLQEEADRELAMSLSRNISQMHEGPDEYLRNMNLLLSQGPRQPEGPQGPQVPSSTEAAPPGGARADVFEPRFLAQEHREREAREMGERLRMRRERAYRAAQDRSIPSPILLRLSPGSRQLVLRFHNARRIAAERAATDDAVREGLDRLHGYELLLELTAEMGEIKPRGATSAEIGLIPEMKYQAWRETTRGADAAPEKDECIICMVELEDSHDLRVLNCTHYFHKLCVDKWLLSCATCPVCRDDIRGGKA